MSLACPGYLGNSVDSQSPLGNICVSRANRIWFVVNNACVCSDSQSVSQILTHAIFLTRAGNTFGLIEHI